MNENPNYGEHHADMTYPPPTLIRRRSRAARARLAVLLFTVALVLGTCTAAHYLKSDKTAATDAGAAASSPGTDDLPIVSASQAPGAVDAPVVTAAAAPQPQAAAPPPSAPVSAPMPAQRAPDARQPNRWYYVDRLGDGPGAIFSGTGGHWDYALACSTAKRSIEFIAVGTGDPGGFQGQTLAVGSTRMDLDASYSKDGGGTISAKLPATSPLLAAVKDGAVLQVKLVASHGATLPINADAVRLIRDCQGG